MAEQLASRFSIPAHFGDFTRLLEELRPDVVHVMTRHSRTSRWPARPWTRVAMFSSRSRWLSTTSRRSRWWSTPAAAVSSPSGTRSSSTPWPSPCASWSGAGLGDPVHVESYYGYSLDGPYAKAVMADPSHWVHALPGGLFQNNIDHLLNKLVEFIHDDEPALLAFGSVGRPQRFGDVRDALLDELRILVRGARTTAYATFSANVRPLMQLVRVYGTRNTLRRLRKQRGHPRALVHDARGAGSPLPPSLSHGSSSGPAPATCGASRATNSTTSPAWSLLRRFYESIRDDAGHRSPTGTSARVLMIRTIQRLGGAMKVVVTGSNGFLGSALVDRLASEGRDEVRCLVRAGSDLGRLTPCVTATPRRRSSWWWPAWVRHRTPRARWRGPTSSTTSRPRRPGCPPTSS